MCQEVLGGRNTAGDSPCFLECSVQEKVDLNRYVRRMICFNAPSASQLKVLTRGTLKNLQTGKQRPKTFLFLICSKKAPASYKLPEIQGQIQTVSNQGSEGMQTQRERRSETRAQQQNRDLALPERGVEQSDMYSLSSSAGAQVGMVTSG